MSQDTLTVTDNRTGKQYQLPIHDGTIRAMDLRQIKVSDDDFGLMTYDPAFMNTASCKSRITFIDGDKGILEYRGYPIDQLAEQSSYLEVAYLLLYGELPTESQLKEWTRNITYHTFINENITKVIDVFITMRTRWACSKPHSERFRLSIPTLKTFSTSSCARNRSTG